MKLSISTKSYATQRSNLTQVVNDLHQMTNR